jgi:ATP-dependent Clp protease ATP-binding subunit ClpC
MPKINIYLSDDLADAVKDAGVPVSAVCQRALEQAVRRVTAIRESLSAPPEVDGLSDPPLVNFTRRLLGMLESAQACAQAAGASEVGTEHLLGVLAADQDSLAMRVLAALEITPRQINSALAGRGYDAPAVLAGLPADAEPAAAFGPQASLALQLAAAESSGLGNNYVGSEHVLLGLIDEPDGTGGSVLRALGADLRVTRRTVAAALVGWGAARAAGERLELAATG